MRNSKLTLFTYGDDCKARVIQGGPLPQAHHRNIPDRHKIIGVFFVAWYNELHKAGVFDILNHKSLTRGHTFLRNDSDFAQFEKGKSSAIVLRL